MSRKIGIHNQSNSIVVYIIVFKRDFPIEPISHANWVIADFALVNVWRTSNSYFDIISDDTIYDGVTTIHYNIIVFYDAVFCRTAKLKATDAWIIMGEGEDMKKNTETTAENR